MASGASLMDLDIEVDCEGGILECWLDEEGGVGGRHSKYSNEET